MAECARLGMAGLMVAIAACHHPLRSVRADSPPAAVSSFVLAAVPEDRVQRVLSVDGANPNASDNNPGTSTQPLATIAKAVRAAEQLKRQGIGVKVSIHSGTYREQVSMPVQAQETDAPLVLEGAGDGPVILSGSDVWTGWQPQATSGVYKHAWPYQWGMAPYPPGWEGNVVLQPIVRRREMVFVNRLPLLQVLTLPELAVNTFYVSEAEQSITIRVAPQASLAESLVEVATRSPVLSAQGKKNLVLRGLSFRHGNSAVPDSAVLITDSSGVLVENCDFWWNNWDGLDVLVSNDVSIRNVVANNNGASGLGGYKLKRLVMDGAVSSYDNWRGAQGQFYGWAVGGGKFGAIHDAYIHHYQAAYNQSRGLWLDFDNVNVSLESCGFYNNKTDGLFVEANAGPIAVRNSFMALNVEGAGLSGSNSSDVTLSTSAVWGNGLTQVQITGVDSRAVTNWETGATVNVRPERWSLTGNLIWSNTQGQLWVQTPDWPSFLTTLTSRANVWSRPSDPRGFMVGAKPLALFDWQQWTSADRDSVAFMR